MNIIIRKAEEKDSENLDFNGTTCCFEKYIDSFAITPEIVKESGFRKNPQTFIVL